MTITDLIIDPRSLGKKLWLVDVMPVYEYRNNKRTENVTGYRYVVAVPEKNLDKIGIKIDEKSRWSSLWGMRKFLLRAWNCLSIG